MKRKLTLGVGAGLMFMAATAVASPLDTISDAFVDGDHYANFRYRFENVDQTGFSRDAHASTLRSRIGIKTGSMWGFKLHAEAQDVSQIGNEMYNDTLNGVSNRPVVVDVESTMVNQANITYENIPDTVVKYGRQVINWGNQRMVGEWDWRQVNQTFDGVTVANNSIEHVTLMYAYLNNVNNQLGDSTQAGDVDGDFHIGALNWNICDWLDFGAYGIFLDADVVNSISTNTYGGTLSGNYAVNDSVSLGYYAEYAYQEDGGNNPLTYDANYLHFNPSVTFYGVTLQAGYEQLGSDNGAAAFITPLGSQTNFNGWADQFITTPATGLQDWYFGGGYELSELGDFLNSLKLAIVWHDFSADSGSADYGTELDVDLTTQIADSYMFGLRYADYNADSFSVDTQKFIISVGANFS